MRAAYEGYDEIVDALLTAGSHAEQKNEVSACFHALQLNCCMC